MKNLRHLISHTYTLLFSDQTPKTHWSNQKWEQELSINLTDLEWENIYTQVHKGTMNVQVQENAFKILSRWYRTPLKLHLINPAVSQICWRCKKETGLLLHIWWNYVKIQPFWKEIHRLINYTTTYSLEFAPAQFLLHRSTIPTHTYFRSLAMHLINAAKMCVPTKWHSPDPPTIADWFNRIQKTMVMEDLIHQARDTPAKFTKTWACWLHFITTDEYIRNMN